jgi:hypothetical protein
MKVGDLVKVIKDDVPWQNIRPNINIRWRGQLGIITKTNHELTATLGTLALVLLTSNGKHWFSCDDLEVQE